jgi:mono/diheme cytochrome c family protein
MNETLFYVLGIGLVVAALVVSVLGVRSERFPPARGVMVGITALFAALVVATGAFAWLNAEDEQEHREAELAHAEQENIEEGDTAEAQEEGATTTETTTPEEADGAQVFVDEDCGGCHTLEAAGTTGTVGPVLDSSLQGKSEEFIRTSIVDPNAEIAEGFPPDTMPQIYGDELSPEQLDALVTYLAESTGAKG